MSEAANEPADGPLAAVGEYRDRPTADVLADRLAAALVHHEPGWRLPRHTALARRFNVSTAQIDAAIENLSRRHLIRRLADGQLYRASPAEYLIPLEGVSHLRSQLDPMGGELTCRSHQVSWRRVPEDIGWALGISGPEPVCVARFLWASGGEPAAFSTTYLPGDLASRFAGGLDGAAGLGLMPLTGLGGSLAGTEGEAGLTGRPGSLHIELQPPPPSVARSLRLSAGQPAALVTLRFDDPDSGRPVALTIAVLRPEKFRIVVQSAEPPLPDLSQPEMSQSEMSQPEVPQPEVPQPQVQPGSAHPDGAQPEIGAGNFSGMWTHVVEDWEP